MMFCSFSISKQLFLSWVKAVHVFLILSAASALSVCMEWFCIRTEQEREQCRAAKITTELDKKAKDQTGKGGKGEQQTKTEHEKTDGWSRDAPSHSAKSVSEPVKAGFNSEADQSISNFLLLLIHCHISKTCDNITSDSIANKTTTMLSREVEQCTLFFTATTSNYFHCRLICIIITCAIDQFII